MFYITTDVYPESRLGRRVDVVPSIGRWRGYEMVQEMLHDLTTKEGEMVSLAFILQRRSRYTN